MSPPADPHSPARKGASPGSLLAAGLLWAGFLYFWIAPLVHPRGFYFWGHHKLRDVFPDPVALAAIGVTAGPAR